MPTIEELRGTIRIDDKDVNQKTSRLRKGFGNLAKSIAGIAAAAASFEKLTQFMQESVEAFREQEEATRALKATVKANPMLDGSASDSLQQFADRMQDTTTVTDKAVERMSALLASSGRTEEEIQKMTRAAADMAAVTEMDFTQAVEQLNATFAGTRGELEDYVTELSNMSEEQLRAGDAVDAVSEKFSGFASEVADTSSGEMKQLNNAFTDLKEAAGERFLQSTSGVIGWLKDVASNAADAAEEVNNINAAMETIEKRGVSAVENFGDGLKAQQKIVSDLQTELENLGRRTGDESKHIKERREALKEELAMEQQRLRRLKQAQQMQGRAQQVAEQAAEEQKENQEEMSKWMKLLIQHQGDIESRLRVINDMNALIGESYDAQSKKAKLVKGHVKEMLEEGFVKADPAMQKIMDQYGHLLEQTEKAKTDTKDMADELARMVGLDIESLSAPVPMGGANIESFNAINEVVDRATPKIEDMVSPINDLMASLDTGPEVLLGPISEMQSIFDDLNKQWEVMNNKAQVFNWDRLKLINERIKTTRSAMVEALEKGVEPTDEAFQNLVSRMEDAQDKAEQIKEEMKKAADETMRMMDIGPGGLMGGATETQRIMGGFGPEALAPPKGRVSPREAAARGNIGAGGPLADFKASDTAPRRPTGGQGQLIPKLEMVPDRMVEATKKGIGGAFSFLQQMFQKAEIFSKTISSLTDDIVTALMPAIKLLSRILSTLSPVLKFLGKIVSEALVPVFKVLATIVSELTPIFKLIGAVLQALGSILQALMPAVKAIFQILKAALAPILKVVAVLLSVLAPIIEVVTVLFKALSPVIEILFAPLRALGEVLVWLHDNVFVKVGNILVSAAETMANHLINIVQGVISAINSALGWAGVDISKPSNVSFGSMSKIGKVGGETDFSGVGDVSTEGLEGTLPEGGGTGGAGTIEQERPITVNVDVYDNEIAGDGSFRDFAQQIRRELEAIEAINA